MNISNERSHSFMHSFILSSCTDSQTSKRVRAVGILTTGTLPVVHFIVQYSLQTFRSPVRCWLHTIPQDSAGSSLAYTCIRWFTYTSISQTNSFSVTQTLMIETESVSETLNILQQPDMAFSLRRCY